MFFLRKAGMYTGGEVCDKAGGERCRCGIPSAEQGMFRIATGEILGVVSHL